MYNFHMGINQRWGYISFYLAYNGDIIYDIYYIYTCIRLWWLWKRQYEVGEFAWGLNQYDPGPDHCRKLPSSAGISGLLPGCRSQFLLAISEDIWTLSSFFLLVTSTFFDCLNPQLLSVSGTFLSPWMGLPATLAGLKSTKNGATPCWFEIDRSTSLQLGATRSSLQAFREAWWHWQWRTTFFFCKNWSF